MMNQGKGYSDVLVGLQYGDEGKAKIVDLVAPEYDIVARFNGGANAGHTIETDQGKYTLQQVPSAVSNPNASLYIGSGCIINAEKLVREIEKLESSGMSVRDRLVISPFASIIQPHHIILDRVSGGAIGTTNNGIGPAYADRALRLLGNHLRNVRVADLASDFEGTLTSVVANLNRTIETLAAHDLATLADSLTIGRHELDLQKMKGGLLSDFSSASREVLAYVATDPRYLCKEVEKGARVLFEGAQSVMLDVARGTTPFVTSSATVAGAAYSGGDLPPRFHRKTIGIAKLLMSRVGRGPFASEFGGAQSEEYCLTDNGARYTKQYEKQTYEPLEMLKSPSQFERGIGLRMLAGEYGSNTSRPRRIGALDLVQLTEAARDNGVDELYLTKADILRNFSDTPEGLIPVVSAYTHAATGEDIVAPAATADLKKLQVRTEMWPGFTEDIGSVREFDKLPESLRNLLEHIEQETGATIVGVGTGPQRTAMAMRSRK
ncbi:MAG: hypothetical protein RL518_1004 [Pseudomonadota bacterium]|jgi:adenylosuccinate synthase